MITLDNLEELKRKVEAIQRRHDQAVGAREQVVKRLKEEYGAENLKEAKALLAETEVKERKVAARYAKKKKEFETEWKSVLESL